MVASQGRGQDTMLAHINPREAQMLRSMGGVGTLNPVTGLPEYNIFKKIGNVFKAAGNVVKDAVKGIGTAVKQVVSSPVGRMIAIVAISACSALHGPAMAFGIFCSCGSISSFYMAISFGYSDCNRRRKYEGCVEECRDCWRNSILWRSRWTGFQFCGTKWNNQRCWKCSRIFWHCGNGHRFVVRPETGRCRQERHNRWCSLWIDHRG
jgi:hypothetical protein